jgi:hypothetical protein
LLGKQIANAFSNLAQSFFQTRFALPEAVAQYFDLIPGHMAGLAKRRTGEIAEAAFDFIQKPQGSMLRLRLWPKCSDEQADSDAGNNRREKRGARMAADTLFHVLNVLFDDAVRLLGDVIRFDHNA